MSDSAGGTNPQDSGFERWRRSGLVRLLPGRSCQRGGPVGAGRILGGVKKIGAGLGQLWDKAPAGIGKAITRETKGAGEAISKTADAFATNKDLQKYSTIALGAGALPIVAAAGATAGPAVVGTAMQHPAGLAAASEMVSDFASGYIDEGPPPSSMSGYIGGLAGKIEGYLE